MYIPHKEIKISWGSNQNDLIVSLPWVNIEIDIDPNDKSWIQEAISNLYNLPTHSSVQRFLEPLKEYNVGYYAPPKHNQIEIQRSLNESDSFDNKHLRTPSDFIKYLVPNLLSQLNKDIPLQWTWDLNDILNKGKIHDTSYFDALSIGSLLIGKHLETEAQTKNQRIDLPARLNVLRLKDEERFFNECRQLIRQTHYVTSRFQEYAPLALESFKEAHQEVEGFIEEELGHDKLMSNSLKTLGCENPEDIPVLPEIVVLMELLRESADKFPLAFSCLISFFEGMSYGNSDPIADVLLKSTCPEAAKGYQIHFNINKQGNHKDEALCLLKKLPPQNMQEVEFAARTLELAAKLGNILDVSVIRKIKIV